VSLWIFRLLHVVVAAKLLWNVHEACRVSETWRDISRCLATESLRVCWRLRCNTRLRERDAKMRRLGQLKVVLRLHATFQINIETNDGLDSYADTQDL